MNNLKLTGIIGLIGAVMVGIGEFLMHYNTDGYTGSNYSFFVSIGDSRLITGHFIVVFFVPFYIAGYWHFYLAVKPGSSKLALAILIAGVFAFVIGGMWISSRVEFSWGCLFEDFNLDGRQDLVVAENYVSFPPHALFPLPCRFLIQLPTGKFASVEEQAKVVNKHFAITPLISDFNNDGYPDLVYININGESKAFINNGGKADYLKVRMPDTNEAIGAKVTVNFSDSTTLTNWNSIGEGLSSDQSNILQFAITSGKKVLSVIIKYNSNRINTIKSIQPNSIITVK